MENSKGNVLDRIDNKNAIIITIIILLIPLLYFFSPYILKGLSPSGADSIASMGSGHLAKEMSIESGETALWNPALFCGMPSYHRKSTKLIHIDTIIVQLNKMIDWRFWYFLAGALGIFFLLIYKKIPWYFALIAAIGFMLLPHWQALIHVGHNTKFRAFMIVPWLILSFNYYFDKNTWFSISLFTLVFSWLIRTQHFQVVFYGVLFLFVAYIYPYTQLLLKKEYKRALSLIVKLILAIVLTILIAGQQFFPLKEYTPYSTRGGNPVQMSTEQESAQASGGVSFSYATRWSLAPSEILNFFIPRFSGGISGEVYDGKKYPQLVGRQIPGYWGEMPFTQSYDSMGILLFLLALIGIWTYRKDSFVIALTVFSIFAVFLAFGRHFPPLYKLFFYYVPFFSKFRVPGMIVNMIFITNIILAGFGLKGLFELIHKKDLKPLYWIFGSGLAILVLILLFKNSFSYLAARELGQYNGNTLDIIMGIRKEFLTVDTMKALLLTSILAIFIFMNSRGKTGNTALTIVIFALVFIELFTISNRAYKMIPLNNKKAIEYNTFQETSISKVLSGDKSNLRILALGQEFQSNYFSYYYPAINGYSAIKLQVIQDIIEHNLQSAQTRDKLNWNVINMLNGKYIVTPSPVSIPFLSYKADVRARNQYLYENKNVLPKAWFVKNLNIFNQEKDIINYMNTSNFHPEEEALLLKTDNLSGEYTANGDVTLELYTPNKIVLHTQSDTEQFLQLSEVYYPKGWKSYVDGEEIAIYKSNFLLRGMVIPAGKHSIDIVFHPETYFATFRLAWAANILLLILLFVSYYFEIYGKKSVE